MSFQYTIKDGPMAGKTYGPFPTGKGSVTFESIKGIHRVHASHVEVDGRRVVGKGKYQVEWDGEKFVAIHVPDKEIDVWPKTQTS